MFGSKILKMRIATQYRWWDQFNKLQVVLREKSKIDMDTLQNI